MRQGKGTLNGLWASVNHQEPCRQVQRLLQVALSVEAISVEAPRPQASASASNEDERYKASGAGFYLRLRVVVF